MSSLYAGKIEIKCQVGGCKHKSLMPSHHLTTVILPKNRAPTPITYHVKSNFPEDVCRIDPEISAQPNCRGRCSLLVSTKRRLRRSGWILFDGDSLDDSEYTSPLYYEVEIRIKPSMEIPIYVEFLLFHLFKTMLCMPFQ